MKKRKKVFRTVTANSLEIKDPQGRTRILLDASNDFGLATISLYANDYSSIHISGDPDGNCSISFRHSDGSTSAALGVKRGKHSGLELRDENGVPSIVIAAKLRGEPASMLVFEKGKIRNLLKGKKI